VPLFVNVSVKNHGTGRKQGQLKLQSTFYPPDDLSKTQPDKLTGLNEELATLLIDAIGPGETVSRRVQVYFPQPGKHVIEASLPEDSVEPDNRRWAVIDFPDGERTLLIDGTDEQQHSYYLDIASPPASTRHPPRGKTRLVSPRCHARRAERVFHDLPARRTAAGPQGD
jgi:hypothetical protein